jgi:type IV pilus assembly protein PilQ
MDTGSSAVRSDINKRENRFAKEAIMKNSVMKFHKLILLILLTVITAGGVIAVAEDNDSNTRNNEGVLSANNDSNTGNNEAVLSTNNDSNTGSKEVLSTLEQRMQKRISVDFRDTPIDDVLRIMAEQSGVDIIKSPKVTGVVTATLTNVPLEEALSNILASQGYGYVASNNMMRVLPREEMSEASETIVSKIYQINYANVTEVEAALKKFISPRGSLSSNAGTSNIMVSDSESKMKTISDFIEKIDRITPQIEVEARIYDITSKERFDLGVEWQAGRNSTYTATAGGVPASGTTGIVAIGENPLGGTYQSRTDPFSTGAFKGSTGKTESTVGALRFGWLNPAIDVDILLRAQQENINAKLLANPRILVLDNQKASIKIISEIPYQEITDTSGGGSIGTTAFREVGVELTVTPHLTREGMVRLQLRPKFSVKTGTVIVGTASNQFSQPVVDRREADTTLLVGDGQTVVLGGLRKKDTTKQVNKIPLLGDLPLVGMAFRFQGEDTTISELVVFITPRIIEKPVLTEMNKRQLEVTDFNGPLPVYTGAEKPQAKN